MLQTCKSAMKAKTFKVDDKTKELRGNCNLFARCALIQGKRNIDMKVIIWTDCVSKEYIFFRWLSTWWKQIKAWRCHRNSKSHRGWANRSNWKQARLCLMLWECWMKWRQIFSRLVKICQANSSLYWLYSLRCWASNSCFWYIEWKSLTERQDPHISQKLATPPGNLETNIEKFTMSELLARNKTKQ